MRLAILLTLLLVAVFFSGCTAPFSTAGESGEVTKGVTRELSQSAEGTEGKLGVQPEEEATKADITEDRKIIRNARLSIEVRNFDSSAERVEEIAENSGGYVSDSSSYITETGHERGTVTIRVPAEGFSSILEELKTLGKVESTHTSSQDVTEEYVDLEARLGNLKRQEERLLAILDNATTVEEVLKVEEHLGRVRGEIERIEGRLRYLDNRIDLATITVELKEPEPLGHSLELRETLSQALEGVIVTFKALIVFAGYAIPPGALILLVFYMVRRRKRG